MQMQHAWERNLLELAYEALHFELPVKPASFDKTLLDNAYAFCEHVTSANSRSFHLASALLAKGKRRAVRALYAFCRVSDDIVDRSPTDQAQLLEGWRQRATATHPPADDPVAVAWADSRLRYQVPIRYAEQLIDGVARDLHQNRYRSFAELAEYCYGVASTVGLMSMHIIGFAGEEAIPYAIKLGVALQMTNILRDVGEDWRTGRLYLPQDELADFGLSEQDLDLGVAAGAVTERWRRFMRFQLTRNRDLYAEALPGICLLNRDGRFAIAAAADLYAGILDEIERADFNVFSQRAFVSSKRKLGMLPGIWWHSRHPRLSAVG